MGTWPVDLGDPLGALFGSSSGIDASLRRGASGLFGGTEGGGAGGRRIKVRHRSLTISGQLREHERATDDELYDLLLEPKPQTRGECPESRPCPYVSCRHHLYIEVNPVTGSVQFPFGALGIDEVPNTCSLDAAERGPLTLDEVGTMTNRTKERIRQIETRAMFVMRAQGVSPSMICATMADWLD